MATPSSTSGRGSQIEETPSATVAHFDHDPWNKMELFDDMEEVKGEQNARYPKATHGTEIEPIRP